MPITIDSRKYNVGKAADSVVNILVDPAVSSSWRKTYKRRAGPEDDASFQARVQADVTRMQREKAAEPPPLPPETPTASPASMRGLRQHGEAGKPSPASAGAMEPPPPAKRRAGSRAGSSGSGSCGQQGSCGQHVLPIDAASAAANTAALKKLQKKLREAERLVVMRVAEGKGLSADEHAKAESIAGLQAQIELLKVSASAAGSSAAHSSGGAAVFSRPAAACLASNFNFQPARPVRASRFPPPVLGEKLRKTRGWTIRIVSFCRPTSPDLETVAGRRRTPDARQPPRQTRRQSGAAQRSVMVAEGQQQELERANLEEIVTQIEAEPVPAVESCRKLVEYTQAHLPDPLLNLDPKWAKKKGRNGCVIS